MKVFRADTGEVHDLPDLPSSTLISTIKQHLAILSAIDPQDQIMLCGKLKLEDSRSLDYYHLPAEERPVFLFSRQALQPGSLPPKQTVLGPIEVKLPGESPLPRLAGALVKYEHQFSHHLSFAKGVLVAVDGRIALSRRCYAEQDIQAKALEAATANLNDHNGQILQAFSTFKEHFTAQQSKHYGLLESFAHDLQRLRETVIHEALQTPTMRTLIDCIPEDRLRKWADDCRKEHEQLALRISELEAGIVRVNEEVEAENLKPPDVDFEDLRERINLAVKQRKEAGAIKTAFAQDVKKVREALKTEQENNERGYHDDSRHGGTRSWEDYVPFDQAQKGHVKMLDRLTKIDSSVRSIMNACADSKTRLSQCVHMRLQRISVLQSNIRDVANKVIVFREALSRQKQAFAQLVYVKYLPEAYAASMEEVGRRKVFADILQEAFHRFRSALKKLEEQEIRERQLFLSKFGRYIPKNLVPGLTEPLPPFDKGIKYIPFDRSLPVLDAAQVSSSAVALVYENLPPLFRHLLQPPDKDYPLPTATDKSQQLALRELEEENERLRQHVTKLQKLEEEEQASTTTSHASERVKLLEQSEAAYKQRILALEEKLSRTYRQVSQLQMQLSAASSQNLSSNSLRSFTLSSPTSSSSPSSSFTPLPATTSQQQQQQEQEEKESAEKQIQLEREREREEEIEKLKAELTKLQQAYAAQSELLSFKDSERKQLLRRLEEEQEEREQQLNQKKNEQQQLVQQLEEQLHRALAEKAEAIAAKEAQSASLEAALARVDAEKRKTQKLVQQIKAKKAAEKHKILQVLSQYEEGKRKVADGSDGREKGEGLSASGSGKIKPFRSTSTPALASLPVSLTSTSTPPSFAYSSSSSSSIRGRKTSLAMSPIDEIEETIDTEQQKHLNVEDFEENEEEEETENDESISLSASTSSSASFFQSHKTRKHLRKHSAPATPSSSSSSKATSQAEMLLNSAHQERQLHNTQQELLRAVEKLKEAENKIHELKGTINVLNITNAEYMSTRKELEEQVVALQQQVIALADNQSHKIAYQDFKVDDLALFLPNDLGHYEAFNRNAPNYMLSEESLSMFPDERRKRAAVLGQIIEIVEQVAARRQNPYHKDMGTKFYEVTITQV